MGFFNTFRGRLLLILLFLLVATLGVQYYVNLRTQQENERLRELQTRALVAGMAIGFNSLTSSEDRVADLIERQGQSFLDEETKSRIKDIIIVNNNWQVYDAISDAYAPTVGDNDETVYKNLSDFTDLPPLIEGQRLGEDVRHFPNAYGNVNVENDEAHAVPIETSKGRWYVMVLLRNDRSEGARRAARPLIFKWAFFCFPRSLRSTWFGGLRARSRIFRKRPAVWQRATCEFVFPAKDATMKWAGLHSDSMK